MRRRSCFLLLAMLMLAATAAYAQVAAVTAPAAAPAPATPAMAPAMASSSPPVNLELKDVEVRSALEALFRNTGKNYSIDPNVTGTIPAVSFKDVSFDAALRNLTKGAGLVFRVDSADGKEIYIISQRTEPKSGLMPSAPAPLAYDAIDQTATVEVRVEKIPLNFTSASEILAMLGGSDSQRQYGGYGMMGGGYGMGGYGGGYGGYGGGGYGQRGGYGMGGYGGGYGGYGGGGYGQRGGYGGYGGYGQSGGYGGYGGVRIGGSSGYGGYSGYGGSSGYGGYRGW